MNVWNIQQLLIQKIALSCFPWFRSKDIFGETQCYKDTTNICIQPKNDPNNSDNTKYTVGTK